jgi:hypothetical protein
VNIAELIENIKGQWQKPRREDACKRTDNMCGCPCDLCQLREADDFEYYNLGNWRTKILSKKCGYCGAIFNQKEVVNESQ